MICINEAEIMRLVTLGLLIDGDANKNLILSTIREIIEKEVEKNDQNPF